METLKKTWETPQLIILARGMPEETLTTGCKVIGDGALALHPKGAQQNGCNDYMPTPDPTDPTKVNCGSCQARNSGS